MDLDHDLVRPHHPDSLARPRVHADLRRLGHRNHHTCESFLDHRNLNLGRGPNDAVDCDLHRCGRESGRRHDLVRRYSRCRRCYASVFLVSWHDFKHLTLCIQLTYLVTIIGNATPESLQKELKLKLKLKN